MTPEELVARMDGRPAGHIADTVGISASGVSAWALGRRAIPSRHVETIRRRYPLPDDDTYHHAFMAGYTACKLDAQHAIASLEP